MKRLAIFCMLMFIAAFSPGLPAYAAPGGKIMFSASLTPGFFQPSSESGFVKGEVKVYTNGTLNVTIQGAQPYETYDVLFGWYAYLPPVTQVSWGPVAGGGGDVLQLTTDGKGNGTASGWVAALEPQWPPYSGFALDDADNEEGTAGPNRYLTGFRYLGF
jgi:hypothetical protein